VEKKIDCPHFTNKHHVEKYIIKIGLQSTFLYAGFYMQNFANFGFVSKKDGVATFNLPMRADVGLPLIDINDTGYFVSNILNNPTKYLGQHVYMFSDYVSIPQVVCTYKKVSGEEAKFNRLPMDMVEKLMGKEMYQMFAWFNEYGYAEGVDISDNRKNFPQANTWESFLRNTKTKF